MNTLITVTICSSRIEAEIIKGLLESHGIISFISADDAGGMRPFPLSYVSGVELQVREEDLQKAHKILKESNK